VNPGVKNRRPPKYNTHAIFFRGRRNGNDSETNKTITAIEASALTAVFYYHLEIFLGGELP